MPEPLTIVSSTLNGLATAFKLVEFGYLVRDVPVDSLVFINLLSNVQKDLEYAMACLRDIDQDLAAQPSFHKTWIVGTIEGTLRALDEIGTYVLDVHVDQETSPSLIRRIGYVLNDYKKLSDREKLLRATHSSLLSALNAMHMIIYPRFRTSVASSTETPVQQDDCSKSINVTPLPSHVQTTQFSTLPSRPRLSFESSHSLPILSESPDLCSDWSPQSPTPTPPPHSPSNFSETEYKYPELENAFRETRKSIDSRKSTDSLQRPSRQKPTESSHSLPSALYATRNSSESTISSTTTEIMNTLKRGRNDSQSTISSTAAEPKSRKSSGTSPPENQYFQSSFVQSLHSQPSSISLSETLFSEPRSPPPPVQNRTASTRPSRQKPRPRPQSSFSDSVLASADLKLGSLSGLSGIYGSTNMEKSTLPSLQGDEKMAATVAYDELVDYIQLWRRQSTRGHRHSINISV